MLPGRPLSALFGRPVFGRPALGRSVAPDGRRRRAWGPLAAVLLAGALMGPLSACRPPPAEVDLGANEQEQGVVYGDDNRLDVWAHPAADLVELAAMSTVALVRATDLDTSDPDNVALLGPTLAEQVALCPGEAFADQPTASFCSGTLVDDDLVLTAGHCLPTGADCDAARFVFDYRYAEPGLLEPISLDDDVYFCDEIVAREQAGELDFALVRLDRAPPPPRAPVTLSPAGLAEVGEPLALIGHPTGIPAKIAEGGSVLSPGAGDAPPAFFGTPDAFGGNSGSGVFNGDREQLGILVAGQQDYVFDFNENCSRVNVLEDNQGPGETMTYARRAIELLCAEGFESERLCPQNMGGVCAACTDSGECGPGSECLPHPAVPGLSLCLPPCDPDGCPDGHICVPDFDFCVPLLESVCHEGDVWQADSCGNLLDVEEPCPEECAEGTCVDAGDGNTCASAIALPSSSHHLIVGSLADASHDYTGSCGGNGPERVYELPIAQPSEVEIEAAGFDTLIHVRSSPCEEGQEVACDDDGGPGFSSRWLGELDAGTYYLFLDAWGQNVGEGQYELEITIQPFGCENECEPGEQRCLPGGQPAVQTCVISPEGCGQWGEATFCEAGALCQGGACVAGCVDDCPMEGLSACFEGEVFGQCGFFDDDPCLDGQVTNCGPGEVCVEGAGCLPDGCACSVGEARCTPGEVHEVCMDDGSGTDCGVWVAQVQCNPGLVCDPEQGCISEEGCPGDECQPGTSECLGEGTYRVCQATEEGCGAWSDSRYCFGDTVCTGGLCALVEEPDAGPGPDLVDGGGLFPERPRPGRVKIAAPSSCASADLGRPSALWLLLAGGLLRARRRARR